jgi:hypothetical protein
VGPRNEMLLVAQQVRGSARLEIASRDQQKLSPLIGSPRVRFGDGVTIERQPGDFAKREVPVLFGHPAPVGAEPGHLLDGREPPAPDTECALRRVMTAA